MNTSNHIISTFAIVFQGELHSSEDCLATAAWPNDYDLAYIVESDDLDEVYKLTELSRDLLDESIERSLVTATENARSMMATDVVMLVKDGEISFHLCERCGWREMNFAPVEQLETEARNIINRYFRIEMANLC